ncbi:Phenol metabolism protein [Cupriavidus taiwanensis]|uniref:SphA family protein n=1 Tax=Cupriavidus taiwanensis TaxID=164546 RepID=UPI000E16BD87|nr:transporter [Cupriavidus taiwanensis]SPA03036.1 Phenol metabolism protein [Cupriavidus taiwanensis]
MKTRAIAAMLAGSLALLGSQALAKEGADQYPNGAENWMAGALPPPGTYLLNYTGYYGGKLKDGNGDNANIAGSPAKVDAWFDALRVVKVTDITLLGASWGMQAIVPLVYQSMNFPQIGGRRNATGLGDITIDPIVLGWHGANWHVTTGLDIYVPTGRYDRNDPRASIGANYWSFEPVAAFTWLGQSGWEVSAKFMYNIKGKNTDANFGGMAGSYRSGQELHVDYALGKHIGPWTVGLSGYYLKQVTDDKFNGTVVPEVPGVWSRGRRGEVFAVGPSVSYTNAKGTSFVAQWQHEAYARNRFGGDKFWFKVVTAF